MNSYAFIAQALTVMLVGAVTLFDIGSVFAVLGWAAGCVLLVGTGVVVADAVRGMLLERRAVVPLKHHITADGFIERSRERPGSQP